MNHPLENNRNFSLPSLTKFTVCQEMAVHCDEIRTPIKVVFQLPGRLLLALTAMHNSTSHVQFPSELGEDTQPLPNVTRLVDYLSFYQTS